MNCPTSFLASPPLSLFHQQPSNPTTVIAFIYDKPTYLCLRIGQHQLTNMDMNPAHHVPVRLFCDIDSMILILLNLVKASLHLFLRRGVTQLLAEHSNTASIPARANRTVAWLLSSGSVLNSSLRMCHSNSLGPTFRLTASVFEKFASDFGRRARCPQPQMP